MDGGGRDDLDAEGASQAGMIELDAAQPGFIGHIQCQNQRHAHLGQLAGEQQGAAQVLGVAHLQDGLERLEQQDPFGHFFVFGIGGQGDDAGRIDQRHAGQRPGGTARHFDRGAGVIRDDHPLPGELVKEGGFADIRMPDQRNAAGSG